MSKGTKNGNGNGNGYPAEVWTEIKQEYILGQLSIAAISRSYGPTRQAIMKKADKLGWARNMADDVRAAVKKKSIEQELQQEVTADNYSEAIDKYGELGAGVIGAHKVLFHKILRRCDVTLDRLIRGDIIMDELASGKRIRKNIVVAATLALKDQNTTLRTVSEVVARIVPLQRQAFNIDEDGSGADKITYYIVGDLEKPDDAGMSKRLTA